jgi:TPR repeat protein
MLKFLGPAALEEMEKTGNTALLRAAKMGHLEIVEFLAENGGNIYESNSNGDTALVLAASPDPADNLHRKLEVVKWLVARGYDISEESLHIAQRTSTPKMTREVIHQALRRKKHVDGYLRNSSDGRKGDQGKALVYLRKAAKSGHPDAQLQVRIPFFLHASQASDGVVYSWHSTSLEKRKASVPSSG